MHLQVNWNFSLAWSWLVGGGFCLLALIISIMQLKFKEVRCAAGSEFGFSKDSSFQNVIGSKPPEEVDLRRVPPLRWVE